MWTARIPLQPLDDSDLDNASGGAGDNVFTDLGGMISSLWSSAFATPDPSRLYDVGTELAQKQIAESLPSNFIENLPDPTAGLSGGLGAEDLGDVDFG